ncbi:type VI secretion system baseplate subunit TssG [Aliamphritea ceti]|uniref:type VI secretion system baseplate subunit TssG n=1 Tax=Aliamphritea ceti TaxID=1524258 RepID=UPI0021C3995B|nr:type VI secretion system baseplate subunit TssG [Aliamphritea ceti]
MEDTTGFENDSLTQLILRDSHQFDFFQAVRLLEKNAPVKVGYQGAVAKEQVRFAGHPSLAFASSDIAKARIDSSGKAVLESNFIGLYGAPSPMPVHVTESIIAEQMRIETQDHQTYFIKKEEQLQRLRDYRLDVSSLLNDATDIKKQIKSGAFAVREFSESCLERLRRSESLPDILGRSDYQAFRQGELLLQLYDVPAARQRDFLDLFNHRFTSLLYRSWEKYQPGILYQKRAEDPFSEGVFSLMGAPDKQARERSAVNWPRLLGYAGLIAMNANSVSVMTSVISGYFGMIPVQIQEYVERWADIPGDQLNSLGKANSRLGDDLCLGKKIKDHCGKFRVCIGPLDFETFERFLPDGDAYAALLELIELLMPEQLCFDIELILKREDVPPFTLGGASAPKLGWVGWLAKATGEDPRVVLSNTVQDKWISKPD